MANTTAPTAPDFSSRGLVLAPLPVALPVGDVTRGGQAVAAAFSPAERRQASRFTQDRALATRTAKDQLRGDLRAYELTYPRLVADLRAYFNAERAEGSVSAITVAAAQRLLHSLL